MTGSVGRVGGFFRSAVPGLVLTLLVIAGSTRLGLPLIGPVLPSFGLMGVFFWSVFRPDLMPYWLAFLIGLLMDILAGGPPGLNALLLLAAQAFCASQRRVLVGRTFPILWAGFALVAIAVGAISWLINCIYLAQFLMPFTILMEVGITIALFPLVVMIFSIINARFVPAAPE